MTAEAWSSPEGSKAVKRMAVGFVMNLAARGPRATTPGPELNHAVCARWSSLAGQQSSMNSKPASKTFLTTLRGQVGNEGFAIVLPFDPREVFGRARAPVTVTLREYTYRSTVAIMHGESFVVVNAEARKAAGVKAGDRVRVTLTEDAAPRTVECPPDLEAAPRAMPPAWERWAEMSYTHQHEYARAVLEAKRPETRARRIASRRSDRGPPCQSQGEGR